MQAKWIRKPTGDTCVIFLHGILSSGEACWRHSNGSYWPTLLSDEAELTSLGVYVFTYQTGVFSGSYRLSDIVDALRAQMDLDGVTKSDRLVFVCHSMGGIVARKFLVERASYLIESKKAIALFLVASPSLGSSYANWLSPLARLVGQAQADDLRFVRGNSGLQDLNREFRNLEAAGKLKITGKELVEDKSIVLKRLWRRQVVEPFAGAQFFADPLKIAAADHFSIAKPENSSASQHRLLVKFIDDFLNAPLQTDPSNQVADSLITLHQQFVRGTGNPTDNVSLLERIANSNNPNKRDYLIQASATSTISFMELRAIDLALSDLDRKARAENLLKRCRDEELAKIQQWVPETDDPLYKPVVTAFKYHRYIARKDSPSYAKLNEFLSESLVKGRFTKRALVLSKELETELRGSSASSNTELPPTIAEPEKGIDSRGEAIRLAANGEYSAGMDAANDALANDQSLVTDTKFIFALARCCAALGDMEVALMSLKVLVAKNLSASNDSDLAPTLKFLCECGLKAEDLNAL